MKPPSGGAHGPVKRLQLAWHRRLSPYWFLSFPKSGRTWVKSVIERYLSDDLGVPPFDFESFTPWRRSGPARGVPRMVFVHPHCGAPDPGATARFRNRLGGKRVIVLLRDPRDVVYTYYFRLRLKQQNPRALSLGFSEFLRDPEFGVERIVDFMNTWCHADAGFTDFMLMRFEDLDADPIPGFGRLLEFLGVEEDDAILARAVAATTDKTTVTVEDRTVPYPDEDRSYATSVLQNIDPATGYRE